MVDKAVTGCNSNRKALEAPLLNADQGIDALKGESPYDEQMYGPIGGNTNPVPTLSVYLPGYGPGPEQLC